VHERVAVDLGRRGEQEARADLRRQNIVPTRLRKERKLLGGGGKITPEDIAVFSRQLATMLAAGIPLVRSLVWDVAAAGILLFLAALFWN